MFRYAFVFLCAVLLLSNVALIDARKNYGGGGGGSRHSHSYPKSPGLSGGGSHGYPSSGGLSGGGSHGAGHGGYPSSGGSHGYPAGGGSGSHGYPAGGNSGSHGYPAGGNSGSHGYPANSGNTGGHGYPASSGMSGTNNARYPASHGNNNPSGGTTNIHHHYNYNPPQQISYASPHGAPMHYPVYRGTPPTYVYKYKDSGSKYGTLIAGLALLNLGALGVGAYSLSQNHNKNNNYQAQPGEVCLFGIKKDNGDYEQTRIECQLISSFIYEDMAKRQSQPTNTTTVTTTVTNTTIVNTTNPAPETPQAPGAVNMTVSFTMLPNGTLIPVSVTANDTANVTSGVSPAPAGGASSVSVTTVTNTTTVSALDVKGSPVQVTPGMECFVIRKTSNLSTMKKTVPCGLLQTYADKSLQRKPNSAARNVPAFTITAILCAVFVMH